LLSLAWGFGGFAVGDGDFGVEAAAGFFLSSFCSASTAPTRRMMAWRSGKMPTTSVRQRISSISHGRRSD